MASRCHRPWPRGERLEPAWKARSAPPSCQHKQSRPSGHPLGVAVGDEAIAAIGVLVLEDPVDHVGDGLEPAVRVPRGPLGSPGRRRPRLSGPCTNGSRAARSTPAKARRAGKPSPSRPDGAVVTDTTGRSRAAGSRWGTRARTMVSALMAGMTAHERAQVARSLGQAGPEAGRLEGGVRHEPWPGARLGSLPPRQVPPVRTRSCEPSARVATGVGPSGVDRRPWGPTVTLVVA